jgi:hypothetical protein
MDKFKLPKLDRIAEFDERSRLYRAVADIEDRPLRSKQWECELNLDQGSEGACVGFAWTHELAAKPFTVERDINFALAIYNRARQLDYWPGEDYSGTSVLAGIKAVQEIENSRGNSLIKEYRWAFGTEEVIRTIGYKGPVVLGIEWHSSQYYPDENGRIWLNGDVVGGHAILAKGINLVWKNPDGPKTYVNIDELNSLVTLHNSWGEDWGINGDAWFTVYELNYLLGQDGEACIPMRRSRDV